MTLSFKSLQYFLNGHRRLLRYLGGSFWLLVAGWCIYAVYQMVYAITLATPEWFILLTPGEQIMVVLFALYILAKMFLKAAAFALEMAAFYFGD